MSYDIQIWSIYPNKLNEAPSLDDKWQKEDSGWVYRTRNWQIVISSSVKVLKEDLPEGIEAILPGISNLTELNLEPIHAPKSACDKLISVSKSLAKASHGVILDQQTGYFNSPSGVKRYQPKKRDERFSILCLSWWFTDSPLLTKQGLEKFLQLLECQLPEALPRRYGLYEPPQYIYSETRKDHFLELLFNNVSPGIVWYPNRPVVGVSQLCSSQWGMSNQGFKANYFKINLEHSILMQPGWSTELISFWRNASKIIQPYYGDVRTLNNNLRLGPTYGSDIKTDFHPVRGPWWKGIPRKLGHATVIGNPYTKLWPEFISLAEVENELAFLSTDNWKDPKAVAKIIGGVPKNISQRRTPKRIKKRVGGMKMSTIDWNEDYPSTWPF